MPIHDRMTGASSKTADVIFLRQASGLVKTAGFWDVFIFNVGLISIGLGLALNHLMTAAFYPGSSLAKSAMLATVLMLPIGFGFWFWTTCIPRSGGIYLFLSRGLSASVAFALSFVESVCWLFYAGVAASLIAPVAIVPFLSWLSSVSGNRFAAQWLKAFGSNGGRFVVGTLFILLATGLLLLGMRKYFLVQRIMFVLACLGLCLAAAVLLTSHNAEFQKAFDSYMSDSLPNAYAAVQEHARNAGWSEMASSWHNSLPAIVWPMLPLLGGVFSVGIGGEIRRVSRNQLLGIMGAVLFCGFVFAAMGMLADGTVGYGFQGAVAYNSIKVPEFSTHITPYISLFAILLCGSRIGALLLAAGFAAWIYFWIPGVMAYVERTMLAWSFDRLAPEVFAYVHPRFHTPSFSILITAAVTEGFLYLYVYTEFFATLIFILAAAVAWFITLLVGGLFPFRSKRLYGQSPVYPLRVGRVPLMTVACLLGAAALAFLVYLLWNDPLAAGHDAKSVITVCGVFATGFFVYALLFYVRRRQGINVRLAFQEIPYE